MSKFLNRSALLSRPAPPPQECELPNGDKVLMRVPGGADWRAYQASLRDKDGRYIDKRVERGDELLIATLLIDPDTKKPMFTIDDVMGGVFDNVEQIRAADINTMSTKAYQLYGQAGPTKFVTDEDREKNSSETAPSE